MKEGDPQRRIAKHPELARLRRLPGHKGPGAGMQIGPQAGLTQPNRERKLLRKDRSERIARGSRPKGARRAKEEDHPAPTAKHDHRNRNTPTSNK